MLTFDSPENSAGKSVRSALIPKAKPAALKNLYPPKWSETGRPGDNVAHHTLSDDAPLAGMFIRCATVVQRAAAPSHFLPGTLTSPEEFTACCRCAGSLAALFLQPFCAPDPPKSAKQGLFEQEVP